MDIDIDTFVERTAEAVVRKIDEQRKIDLIAQAVIEHLQHNQNANLEDLSQEGE